MTIKSLLIGSAAAIVAASSAQAADAVVAADPEPVEYVQVCDAFGDGYFYIPGTETCLAIRGYVRAEGGTTTTNNTTTGWVDHDVRITVDAKSDSELGTIASHVRLDRTAALDENADGVRNNILSVDRAHISVGDGNVFNIGLNGSIYDFDPVGEQIFGAGGAAGNQVSFSVAADSATFAVQAVAATVASPIFGHVAAKATFTAGDVGFAAAIGYDGSAASTMRTGAKVNVSYMGFGVQYLWSENGNANAFGTGYTNVFGAGYGMDVSDKLNVAVAADYADGFGGVAAQDAFGLSAIATYTIVENLVFDARVVYTNFNAAHVAANGTADTTALRFRLTRSF